MILEARRTWILLRVAVVVSAVVLSMVAMSTAAATPMPPGPSTVSQAAYPVTVKGGAYSIVNVILTFAPGAGVPNHYHSGNVLVTVLSGEITLTEKGATRVVKTGQNWTEAPRAVHSVLNRGKTACTVAVSILLPKGAEATTLVH